MLFAAVHESVLAQLGPRPMSASLIGTTDMSGLVVSGASVEIDSPGKAPRRGRASIPRKSLSHRVFCGFDRTSPHNLSGRFSLEHGWFFGERVDAFARLCGGVLAQKLT